MDRRRREDISV